MNIQGFNTYMPPTNRNSSGESNRTDATTNRSNKNRGNQAKMGGSPCQNNDLLSALKQLVQQLLKQIQSQQDKPSDDTPNCPPQNNDQPLNLTDSQRQKISSTLYVNPDSISVADSNKDGAVSAGDEITASSFSSAFGFQTQKLTVDEGFALDINDKLGTPLDLNTVGTNGMNISTNITNHLGFFSSGSFHDQDASGNLSAGDILKSVKRGADEQYTPSYYTFTAADMQSLKDAKIYSPTTEPEPVNGQPLPLSDQQRNNINSSVRFASTPVSISILDQDGSNTISAGDLFKSQDARGAAYEHNLSANEAALISGEFGSALTLSTSDSQLLSTATAALPRSNGEMFVRVFDRDSSGALSGGDIAISQQGAMGGVSPPLFPISYAELEVASDGTMSSKKI